MLEAAAVVGKTRRGPMPSVTPFVSAMNRSASVVSLGFALVVVGCASAPPSQEPAASQAAEIDLKEAGVKTRPAAERADLYLSSAAQSRKLLGSRASGVDGARIYNQATADLTVLLRDADHGRLWNRPQTFRSDGAPSYRLSFAAKTRDGVWDADYFTSFRPADDVEQGMIARRNQQDGVGGALVGVHQTAPLEPFSPWVGVTAPVTATLDFKGQDATLTLVDPSEKPKARVAGVERPLNADFSAPLAYYPQKSEWWNGLMGAIRVSQYSGTTGLYMLQPYDPSRIPVIFVHGLISTARMWRNVVNELEMDPQLRGRFQFGVFNYPTGNPPAYSALRLREELAKFQQLHPDSRGYVLIGHSMGGLLARMQATTLTRSSWDVIGKEKAGQFFANVQTRSLVERATIFDANPHVDRLVFICTPHRGSEMALGGIGAIGQRLISLPVDLTAMVTGSLGSSIAVITGDPRRMPNSVIGLSPSNPLLKALDSRPIQAPFHSIIGDRGKGDTPNSSDGVVAYWSSHLTGAKSERIVPGPHGSCELPETLDELRRILRLHLMEKGGTYRKR